MSLLHRKDRLYRFFATLMLVCYGFVGLMTSFQHTDCGLHEQELFLQLPMHVTPQTAQAAISPKDTRLKSAHGVAHNSHHCIACDWQASNLSVALPTFALVLIPIRATRAITTFPRSLSIRTIRTSSRAPPLA